MLGASMRSCLAAVCIIEGGHGVTGAKWEEATEEPVYIGRCNCALGWKVMVLVRGRLVVVEGAACVGW